MASQTISTTNPALGRRVTAAGIDTNFLDQGAGDSKPVVLLHGSGPGVSAYANWRLTLPALAAERRVVAPDLVGFGYTERPPGHQYSMTNWVSHAEAFLDAVGLDSLSLVGNSFGSAMALELAVRLPERVRRVVLMGSVGVPFQLTEGLDAVWGYTPSVPGMREVLDYFAYDETLVDDDLAQTRYAASIQPGFQESFAAMFPPPRQRWVDSMVVDETAIRSIQCPTLIVHGREDRIIPPDTSRRLFELIPNAQLHMFGQCGHWTQIEHAGRFNELVVDFLAEGDQIPGSSAAAARKGTQHA
ncbi:MULTISPECIES: alpha/beta fold hydrolase [Mycobacteriaceae]|uniref:alpha/beta fold hydrolase n=1 Tax=Mycobacteriaceae TaxID=1762 RepID=UPI00030D82F9|nr:MULTISPECIES: alpha/beta hydrolase [Mycobacteriaceae]AMO06528.1 2-hydroxy-6-oxo-2,4-heptadienoate hydrolase [Mycolicibacterium neoaurum]AXK75119.1 alpha/beta fold hydrolase [Mycolicibacterium neoaurum]KUM07901.1 2-hydroxy-6-oxo-2,4-heptadienoate hydrolase [Mycolicibacterium neoaurum]